MLTVRARERHGRAATNASLRLVRPGSDARRAAPGAVVLTEVDRSGPPTAPLVQRLMEGRDVLHPALLRGLALEHSPRPAGIAGQQRRPRRGIDLDALMARRMAGGGDHPDAGHDLPLSIDEFVARAGVVEPRGGRVGVSMTPFVLPSLQVEGRLREHG